MPSIEEVVDEPVVADEDSDDEMPELVEAAEPEAAATPSTEAVDAEVLSLFTFSHVYDYSML